MFNTDPNRPIEDILTDVKVGAINSVQTPYGTSNPGMLWAPFAALIVRLSRDGEKTAAAVNEKTQKLIVLTRILVVMTGLLILLTIPLVIIEGTKFISEIFEIPLHKPEHRNHAQHDDQQSEAAKKPDDARPASVVEPVNKPAVEVVAPPAIEAPKEKKK